MKYCVYLTTYRGNKLPPFYIGSSSVDAIRNGYKGSVGSRKYKEMWQNEIESNPHLFKTRIVKFCYTRQIAYQIEKEWLKLLKCADNPLYLNQPRANKENGKKGAATVRGKTWEEILGKEEAAKKRSLLSNLTKNNWKRPEFSERIREAARDNWKDPELAERMKKRPNKEGYRQAAIRRWNDPTSRAKLMSSMKKKKH
jgi:hypothetical protein